MPGLKHFIFGFFDVKKLKIIKDENRKGQKFRTFTQNIRIFTKILDFFGENDIISV